MMSNPIKMLNIAAVESDRPVNVRLSKIDIQVARILDLALCGK